MKNILRFMLYGIGHSSLRLPVLVALLLVGGSLVAYAQVGGGYTVTWWTVDIGGQQAATGSGGYALHSTVGQPDADPITSSGEKYVLLSGFWPSARNVYRLYLPIVQNNFGNR